MVISVLSAALGVIAMVVAGLMGANNFTMAAIYILGAVPTLLLIIRAMLISDESDGLIDKNAGEFNGNAQWASRIDASVLPKVETAIRAPRNGAVVRQYRLH